MPEKMLEETVLAYQKKGWILLSQTPTTAQLRKPKPSLNRSPYLILLTVAIIGMVISIVNKIIWLIIFSVILAIALETYYFKRTFGHEQLMLLVLDENGKISTSIRKV